jgi:hypothetical protein
MRRVALAAMASDHLPGRVTRIYQACFVQGITERPTMVPLFAGLGASPSDIGGPRAGVA